LLEVPHFINKMRNTKFISGDWNAICDVCGFKFKASELKERWDGLKVCEKDWETRHPQELIRPIREQQALPWTRPEGTDQFVSVTFSVGIGSYCTPMGQLSQADYGTADCARVNNIDGNLVI